MSGHGLNHASVKIASPATLVLLTDRGPLFTVSHGQTVKNENALIRPLLWCTCSTRQRPEKCIFIFLPFNCCSTAVVLSVAINVIILLGLSPNMMSSQCYGYSVYQTKSETKSSCYGYFTQSQSQTMSSCYGYQIKSNQSLLFVNIQCIKMKNFL